MMGLLLSADDEEEKEVTLEFVSIDSIALTKSEVLMDKVPEILLKLVSTIFFVKFLSFHQMIALYKL